MTRKEREKRCAIQKMGPKKRWECTDIKMNQSGFQRCVYFFISWRRSQIILEKEHDSSWTITAQDFLPECIQALNEQRMVASASDPPDAFV
jgi:hypothetical protein